ncbi:heat shock protein [Neokomagataea thailandica NBRC 106555]|uniref:RNA-binding S4 domain-containing protein n=2 Tax=Neokomagataea TaxID=1223423 RepID=A0A4Y6V8D3_9PROT|nr:MULTISPECIES: S4 domain-containing protein [Neokomagataea]QDH24940.1 RNA-binding S4 domain-containing protein [Neokomagataea tanensis]GBR51684.1 heat shock protein [Neokomagataea thailandica NBRC 106555]
MSTDFQRFDVWLYYVRFTKTRSLAAAYIAKGFARINGQATNKPHAKIRVGDTVTLSPRHPKDDVHVWTIRCLGTRRGPASEATLLYENIIAPSEDACV